MTFPVKTATAENSLGSLAEPDQHTEPINIEGQSVDWLIACLQTMKLIRSAERTISTLVEEGSVKCPCHLAIGQEGAAVGLAKHLLPTDFLFGAHRSHAHFLAMGGSPFELFAEVLGRQPGCSGGLGGSMHLIDREHGLMGTVPIVAATISVATGAALAAKLDGRGGIGVTAFGDGATEEGSFHESLNLASVLKLPVLFFCENNLFSSHLHINQRQPFDSVARYAAPHGVPATVVDGNDCVAVATAVGEMVERARTGGGPGLVEAVTYRWKGHVGHRDDLDVGVRRATRPELWQLRDPIARLSSSLLLAGKIGVSDIDEIDRHVANVVSSALQQATLAPYPETHTMWDSAYSSSRGEGDINE